MKYSIVIVAYKSFEYLEKCFTSIKASAIQDYEIILVDNNPDATDDMAKLPYDRFQWDGINHGFAEGCNIGARLAKGEILIFLNPDTEVYGDWADQMAKYMAPDVGAIGPISNFVASIQRVDYHLQPLESPEETAELASIALKGRSVDTKLIIGFCCMIRKEVYEKMGGMDPDLFLGNDDLDLSWRLRLAGYVLLVASDVFVYHAGHKSFETRPRPEVEKLLQESEKALRTKLNTFYQGNPPSAVELWGADFFNTAMPRPMTLSVCMIVRNEDENLPVLMPQLHFADQIVIVDTSKPPENFLVAIGSAEIHRFPWCDDFAAARNFALSKCTSDWVLWLDADDRVPEESAKLIKAALNNPGPRTWNGKIFFELCVHDVEQNGRCARKFFQPRLFPNVPGMAWTGRIHESIIPVAEKLGLEPFKVNIPIQHTGYGTPEIRQRKAERNIRLLEMDEDSPAKFWNLGMSVAMIGQWDKAKEYYDRALTMEWPEPLWPPFRDHLRYMVTKCLLNLDRVLEMESYLEGNIAPDAVYMAGRFWEEKGDKMKAIAFYRAYLDRTEKPEAWPYEVDAPTMRPFAYAGVINLMADEHERHIAEYEKEFQAA